MDKQKILFVLCIAAILTNISVVAFFLTREPESKYGFLITEDGYILDGKNISGFTYGVIIKADNVTISNCYIMDCDIGIAVISSNDIIICGSMFRECNKGISGYATNCLITSSVFNKCNVASDLTENSNMVVLTDCRIYK